MAARDTNVSGQFPALFLIWPPHPFGFDSTWSDQLGIPFLLGASNVLVFRTTRLVLVKAFDQRADLVKPGMLRVNQWQQTHEKGLSG